MGFKSRKLVPIAACVWVAAACGSSGDGTSMAGVDTPSTGGNATTGTRTQAPTAGKLGGTAGAPGNSGGSGNAGAAGTSGGSAGASASGLKAVAMIMSFKAASAAGAAGGGAAGTSGAAAKPGSGSAGSSGSSSGGAAGKAGASGSGSGAGFAVVYGQATFTKVGSTEVDVEIEVMGCDNGKSYPVHIHEGTSCDSVVSQGGHWGAPPTPEPLPPQYAAGMGGAGAAGSGASGAGTGAGAGGHEASHAAGSSGGASGAAGSSATAFLYRGEGIPDIKCTGTTGVTSAKRNSFDKRVLWTIGTMTETDVVGHVVVVHDGADRIACGKIELKN